MSLHLFDEHRLKWATHGMTKACAALSILCESDRGKSILAKTVVEARYWGMMGISGWESWMFFFFFSGWSLASFKFKMVVDLKKMRGFRFVEHFESLVRFSHVFLGRFFNAPNDDSKG